MTNETVRQAAQIADIAQEALAFLKLQMICIQLMKYVSSFRQNTLLCCSDHKLALYESSLQIRLDLFWATSVWKILNP